MAQNEGNDFPLHQGKNRRFLGTRKRREEILLSTNTGTGAGGHLAVSFEQSNNRIRGIRPLPSNNETRTQTKRERTV